MNSKLLIRHAAALALGFSAFALASPSFAVELAVVPAQWTPPGGGAPIAMWAYVDAGSSASGYTCPSSSVPWQQGPTLTAAAGTSLTINVKNCLTEPVSVFIPGQYKPTTPAHFTDAQGRSRVRSFDVQVTGGGIGSYTWNNVKEGTYLYHSGTHPQVQVQMGLYGALVVTGTGYPLHDEEQVLLYSEIDPALHAAVAGGTYGSEAYPSTFHYYPQYFLINGQAFNGSSLMPVTTGANVLLRFVNAGLKTHTPTLGGGLYMRLISEDGNLYPFPVQQYGLDLPAAKTIDALLTIGSDGQYALYDRGLALADGTATGGGMLAYLEAGAAAGAPTVVDKAYSVAEDTSDGLVVAAPGVLTGATAGTGGTMTASLVSDVSSGALVFAADGSFAYAPNSNFNGTDQFTYVANDGGANSNVATVTITVTPVNDVPVASADAYDAVAGSILNAAAPGVLANDADVDGDSLTAVASGSLPSVVTVNPNGSFSVDATLLAAGTTVAFDYVASDGTADSEPVTVTITVVAPVNSAPVANDDSATTQRSTAVAINVVANDTDADGTIDLNSVTLDGAVTQAGGTVVNSGGGIVTYTPKNGFRGTDTFTYTVRDNLGATSNVATVRVNVVR